jgi:hypothetical protein
VLFNPSAGVPSIATAGYNPAVLMVGTPVSGSPALAKRIRFIHPVEKKLKASYYRVPEDFLRDRRMPDLQMNTKG